MNTKNLLPDPNFQYSSEAKEYMDSLLTSFLKKVIATTDGIKIADNTEKFMPKYIAAGAKHAINKSISQNKPVISIDKLLPKKNDISPENKQILSYLLQYIAIEILDLATNHVRDLKKKRIMKKHIKDVIDMDAELPDLF